MGEFSDSISQWCDRVRRDLDRIPREYTREGGQFIVDVTPFITGKLRGGYYVRINSDEVRPSLPVDPSGIFTKALIAADALRVTWGDRVEIVNDVYYGYFVDQGTLYFEGRNMVGKTLIYLEGLNIGFQ